MNNYFNDWILWIITDMTIIDAFNTLHVLTNIEKINCFELGITAKT